MTASSPPAAVAVQIIPVDGLPEIRPGDDLAAMIGDAITTSIGRLEPGDIIAITHKIVSKAEGALVDLRTVTPSTDGAQLGQPVGQGRPAGRGCAAAGETGRADDARADRGGNATWVHLRQRRGRCLQCRARHRDPAAEGSGSVGRGPAGRTGSPIHAGLGRCPLPIGTIVTDSFGRPWRNGIVNVAIGVAGIPALADYRGQHDPSGYELRASILAIADELAAAAELVMHKIAARPVAVIRGYQLQATGGAGTARDLVMPEERNLFP